MLLISLLQTVSPIFNTEGFGLTVIEFLTCLSLFSQIRDEFGVGSGIVTHALPRLYFKNIFLLLFVYFNINNNNNNNENFFNK